MIKLFIVQFPQEVTQKYLGKCNLVLLTSDPASALGDGEDYYASINIMSKIALSFLAFNR